MPAVQPQLNLRDPRYRRPSMTVDAAKGALDRTEDEVVALVDTYALVAWNIAMPGVTRRELRILTKSVSEYIAANEDGSCGPCYHSMIPPETAATVLLDSLTKPFLTTGEIQRMLNCGATHVLNLISVGCLRQLPDTTIRRGPTGYACVTRDSFLHFLNSRIA